MLQAVSVRNMLRGHTVYTGKAWAKRRLGISGLNCFLASRGVRDGSCHPDSGVAVYQQTTNQEWWVGNVFAEL